MFLNLYNVNLFNVVSFCPRFSDDYFFNCPNFQCHQTFTSMEEVSAHFSQPDSLCSQAQYNPCVREGTHTGRDHTDVFKNDNKEDSE